MTQQQIYRFKKRLYNGARAEAGMSCRVARDYVTRMWPRALRDIAEKLQTTKGANEAN